MAIDPNDFTKIFIVLLLFFSKKIIGITTDNKLNDSTLVLYFIGNIFHIKRIRDIQNRLTFWTVILLSLICSFLKMLRTFPSHVQVNFQEKVAVPGGRHIRNQNDGLFHPTSSKQHFVMFFMQCYQTKSLYLNWFSTCVENV